MPRDDGGPAFPGQETSQAGGAASEMQYGMSLRDWFAGHVLAGLMSDHEGLAIIEEMAQKSGDHTPSLVAEVCYSQADAMMKVRDL